MSMTTNRSKFGSFRCQDPELTSLDTEDQGTNEGCPFEEGRTVYTFGNEGFNIIKRLKLIQ